MDFISAVNTQDLITLLTAEDDMMLRSIVFTDPIAAIFHAPLAQHATRTDLIAPLPGGSRYRSTRRSIGCGRHLLRGWTQKSSSAACSGSVQGKNRVGLGLALPGPIANWEPAKNKDIDSDHTVQVTLDSGERSGSNKEGGMAAASPASSPIAPRRFRFRRFRRIPRRSDKQTSKSGTTQPAS